MGKKQLLSAFKIVTPLSAFGGVLISLFYAQRDGYSHWSRRLLYFTAQSNLWIGIVFLLLIVFRKQTWKRRLYLFKYVFTVSITATGLIFCFLLAPFSDDSYTPWTFCNLLTHVLTPLLTVADFFLDDYRIPLKTGAVFSALLPPLSYCVFAWILEGFQVDFGRGVCYPYFFLNYRSPAKLFGFSSERPFFVGSFYWLLLFLLLILGISFFYARYQRKKSASFSITGF